MRFRLPSPAMRLLAVCALFLGGMTMVLAAPLLQAGDRMVFLGDSITEQKIYTRYVMNYFTLRYPGAQISFRNAGWSGDTAPGGLNRLQRDVLSLKPTVVSICFGMNDGRYTAFQQDTYTRYMTSMTGLVTALKEAGVKVVLLTPGCVDPDKRTNFNVYNETLGQMAKGIEELAAKENVPVFNIHTLMLNVQTKAKADKPGFSMIGDGVHPNPAGQAVMAYGLLKALGCSDPASGLTIDAAKAAAIPDRCTVQDLKVSATAISFTRTDNALPMAFDRDALAAFPYFPILDEMNSYSFKVTGLMAGDWKLTVQGMDVGTFSAEALAAGVNLAMLPGPWVKMGEEVNRLSSEQEATYFFTWRQIRLGNLPKEVEADKLVFAAKLDEAIATKEAARIALPHARTWAWSLSAIPAP